MEESLALQDWLVAGLLADPVLAAAGVRVHDGPPPDANPPYVALGPDTASDWGWKGGGGKEHRLVLTLWTGRESLARTKALLAEMERAIAGLPRRAGLVHVVTLRVVRALVKRNPKSWTAGRLELLVRTVKE